MATKDIALGILIGGAVSSTLGRAVNEVGTKLDALKKRAGEARVWQNTIGETQRLQREFRDLHAAGDRAADKVRIKIERNTRALREAGFEVDRLDRSYQRLGRTARGLELRARGAELVADGRDRLRNTIGDTTKFVAAAAVPTAISAGYEAIIRDIAIKAGAARTDKEREMSSGIAASAQQSGIGRNVLADAVNQMVSAGMDLDRALSFAPLVGKFSVSQGSDAKETARMIQALEQNAKIADPAKMAQALETIAFQGKEGSFESSDMARWFPVLLADMQKLGIVGNSSVEQLGALLQVQMKTAGSADEAANNTKNWFSKIGSGETAGNYAKAGIDYQAKMREAIGKGWSTMEASFVLARAYIEQADPEKAKQLAAAAQQFNSESDPAKREAQMRAFAETMKTGDLFNDMQVKAALTTCSAATSSTAWAKSKTACWPTAHRANKVSTWSSDAMAMTIRTSDGDVLDVLCYRAYGTLAGTVEAVLDANPAPIVLRPTDLMRYRLTFPDRSSVGGVRTRAHDAKTGRKIDLYIPNPEAPNGPPAQATHTDRHVHASPQAAKAAAKAKLQDMNRSTAEGELEMMGRGDISAEKTLRLEGFKAQADGDYLAETVMHIYANKSWLVNVSLNGGNNGKAKAGQGKAKKAAKVTNLVIPAPPK